MSVDLVFDRKKTTLRTVVFAERVRVGGPVVGSLYVQKAIAGNAQTVRVRIEFPEETRR